MHVTKETPVAMMGGTGGLEFQTGSMRLDFAGPLTIW